MDEILISYKQGKFKKCLELISLLEETDSVVRNFSLENCKLMCNSYIRISENDPVKINEMQEQHYLFFEKLSSVAFVSNSIPLNLRLNVTFNFIYCLLFYNDVELSMSEEEEYLELVNKGLLTVLGTQVNSLNTISASGKILNNLMCLKNLIFKEEHDTVLLILELVIVVIFYVIKLKKDLIRDCLKVVTSFVEDSKLAVNSIASVNEFFNVKPDSFTLFKFSLYEKVTSLSGLDGDVVNYFYLLESTFLYLLEDFRGSLKSLQKNVQTSLRSLWNYLVILNSFELENWNTCSGFLIKSSSLVVHKSLKARFHIMQGKLESVQRRHREALKEFEIALSLAPNCPVTYYYLGQEYGKIGLIDLMIENFEKLVQVLQVGGFEEEFKADFETTVLDWIHPVTEISEVEALYALAVSHGLNENFKNSADTFEKVLELPESCFLGKKKRIVEMPTYLTILHESSIMNLLLGNLVRAEQISLEAIDRYVQEKKFPAKVDHKITLLYKNIEWLQQVIQQELLEINSEPKELSNEALFLEDSLLIFSQNVVGLLILSEIQRIQEIEECETTLSNVFSVLSKYLVLMHKRETLDDDEKHLLTLVKALVGKTCVKIAAIQMKHGCDSNVEKMFKRALSCNKGDRDALFNYYGFLLKAGKKREALKLWNTFFQEKGLIETDLLQSFSLRYFLTDKITSKELEKIQREVAAMNA